MSVGDIKGSRRRIKALQAKGHFTKKVGKSASEEWRVKKAKKK